MTNEKKPTIELGKQYQTRDGRDRRHSNDHVVR